MSPIAVVLLLLQLYIYVILADVIMTWLINFNVINASSPFVRSVHSFTYKMTNPAYQKIRSVVPAVGGLDLSPLVLILGIEIIKWAVVGTFSAI